MNPLTTRPFPRSFAVALVLTLAACVRLATAWPGLRDAGLAQDVDTVVYRQLAASLARGEFPSLFRTPGYPLFLLVTGGSPDGSVIPAILVQIALDCGTCWLIMAAARRLGECSAWSWSAGLLYAVSPVAAKMSGMLLSETLSVFLTAAAIAAAVQPPKKTWTAFEIACWLLATMTRPFNLLVPIWLAPWLVGLATDRRGEVQRRVVVLAVYAAAMAAWVGFNYQRSGMPIVCSNPQVSFYIYDVPALRLADEVGWREYARLALLKPAEFDERIVRAQHAFAQEVLVGGPLPPGDLWATMDDPAWIRQISQEAARRVAGRTPALVAIHACGVAQTLRPKWSSASWTVRILELLRLALLPVGLYLLWRRREGWLLTLALVWLTYSTVLAGPAAYWRFRAFAEPIISIVGGFCGRVSLGREARGERREARKRPTG